MSMFIFEAMHLLRPSAMFKIALEDDNPNAIGDSRGLSYSNS
jgi:hypothetical protein